MSTNSHFDVIVIGVGTMGAVACFELAKAGMTVLGLEQFSISNELGSHTGQSRIIRKAYFEHPDYVPLMQRAYTLWDEIEKSTGTQLYYETGLLYVGKPAHAVMQGVRSSALTFQIPLEILSAREASARYPYMIFPEDTEVLFEPEAGFLRPELCIQTYAKAASQAGAVIKANSRVAGWEKSGEGYLVRTSRETYTCNKLIITAGPWVNYILPEWRSLLRVSRQVLAWVTPELAGAYQLGSFPCWIIAEEHVPGVYYGFPNLPSGEFEAPYGFKFAHHYGGDTTNPSDIDRHVHDRDVEALFTFAKRYFTQLDFSQVETKTCMYTNTRDQDFIIDFLPDHDRNVIVATGFSGHGFKFASVIGEILCQMAMTGVSQLDIEFLSAARFVSG